MSNSPYVIAMNGIPGSGKTTIARLIGVKFKWEFLNPEQYRNYNDNFSIGSAPNVDECWYLDAESSLKANKNVIMDATFHTLKKRKKLYNFVAKNKCKLLIISCIADYDTLLERLNLQNKNGTKMFKNKINDILDYFSKTIEDVKNDSNKPAILEINTTKMEISLYNITDPSIVNKIVSFLNEHFGPMRLNVDPVALNDEN